MNEYEKNQESINRNLDDEGIEILIDKKIAEAKVIIAEKRLNFVLAIGAAFLTIFGIFIPIFLSQQSENRVDAAIEKMESKFNELAGKQLRKAKIACYVEGENLTNNIVRIGPDVDSFKSIMIKNIGDGAAENVTMRLYINSENDNLSSILFFEDFRPVSFNDRPEFKWSYRNYENPFVLPAQDSFLSKLRLIGPNMAEGDIQATAILQIFYGEPTPQEMPFTIEIKKKDGKTGKTGQN